MGWLAGTTNSLVLRNVLGIILIARVHCGRSTRLAASVCVSYVRIHIWLHPCRFETYSGANWIQRRRHDLMAICRYLAVFTVLNCLFAFLLFVTHNAFSFNQLIKVIWIFCHVVFNNFTVFIFLIYLRIRLIEFMSVSFLLILLYLVILETLVALP